MKERLARVVWLPVIAVLLAIIGTVLVLLTLIDLAAVAFVWAIILAIFTTKSE